MWLDIRRKAEEILSNFDKKFIQISRVDHKFAQTEHDYLTILTCDFWYFPFPVDEFTKKYMPTTFIDVVQFLRKFSHIEMNEVCYFRWGV